MSLRDKHLAARVQVTSPDIARLASAELPDLQQRLTKRGFVVDSLTTAVVEQSDAVGEDLRARVIPQLALVDVHG